MLRGFLRLTRFWLFINDNKAQEYSGPLFRSFHGSEREIASVVCVLLRLRQKEESHKVLPHSFQSFSFHLFPNGVNSNYDFLRINLNFFPFEIQTSLRHLKDTFKRNMFYGNHQHSIALKLKSLRLQPHNLVKYFSKQINTFIHHDR